MCHRVASFSGKTSGKAVVNDNLKRKIFTTASTEYGIQNEELAIEKYSRSRNVTVEKGGLFVVPDRGYLAASPDGIITRPVGEKGLLEVKVLQSSTDVTVLNAYKDQKYPVSISLHEHNQRVPKLKKTHQYHHQVQLQLYCCSLFAQFVDFVILHVNTDEMHVESIYPDPD